MYIVFLAFFVKIFQYVTQSPWLLEYLLESKEGVEKNWVCKELQFIIDLNSRLSNWIAQKTLLNKMIIIFNDVEFNSLLILTEKRLFTFLFISDSGLIAQDITFMRSVIFD